MGTGTIARGAVDSAKIIKEALGAAVPELTEGLEACGISAEAAANTLGNAAKSTANTLSNAAESTANTISRAAINAAAIAATINTVGQVFNTMLVVRAINGVSNAIDRATAEKHAKNNSEQPAKLAKRLFDMIPTMCDEYEHVSIICSNIEVEFTLKTLCRNAPDDNYRPNLIVGPHEWNRLFEGDPINVRRLIYIDTATSAHIADLHIPQSSISPDANAKITIIGASDHVTNAPLVSYDRFVIGNNISNNTSNTSNTSNAKMNAKVNIICMHQTQQYSYKTHGAVSGAILGGVILSVGSVIMGTAVTMSVSVAVISLGTIASCAYIGNKIGSWFTYLV
jgi:hypothetical protein